MRKKSIAKPFDYVIILAVIVLAALVFMLITNINKSNAKLQVLIHTENGEKHYDISKNEIVSVSSNGYKVKIEIKDNTVKILETDCPNQFCKDAGKISSNGQIIICAPALLYVKIVALEVGEDDQDIVIG